MQSLRGIFPKPNPPPKRDFIRENIKNLKHNQHISQDPKSIEFDKDRQRQKKIRSTSHSRLCSSTKSVKNVVTSKSIENVAKFDYNYNTRPLSVQSRDACSQTESVDDELFLKDVIIRLPSASICNNKANVTKRAVEIECPLNRREDEIDGNNGNDETKADTTEELVVEEESFEEVHGGIINQSSARISRSRNSARESQNIDIDRPIHQYSSRCEHSLQLCAKDNNKPTIPTSYRKGEIPKYLKERKIKEVERSRLISQIDPNCPPGHTVMSEEERIESLNIAQKKYQDLIDELNHMPLSSKTLRIRNRKIEIEKELRQLDYTIQIFSRSRVYVKDENCHLN